MRFAIDDMRCEAEALILEQSLRSWQNRVYGEEVSLAQTYEGHDALFAPDSLNTVERAIREAEDERERKALRYFRRYLLSERIDKAVAPLGDEIRNTEASASVVLDGARVPYHELAVLLASEGDYGRRQSISDAHLPVLRQLEPRFRNKEAMSCALARNLGFPSYNALSEELRSFSLDELAAASERILSDTEGAYRKLLAEVTPAQMDLPPEKFRRCDIPKLFRMDKYARFFPPEKMMPSVTATLRGLGIDLSAQKNILIHDLPLPKKNPRAACYALKVPEDIRLTLKPTGGVSDYETLLHEMGHAQHYAHTSTDRFEFKQLGDNTVTEAYAFLFEELTDDAAWIEEFIRIPSAELPAYLRFRQFSRIYLARRYAAKLLYEKELHSGAPNARERYRRLLSRAYCFPLDEKDSERYLADVDDFYYVADYLRAWFLKAQLERALAAKFGRRWFMSPRAGEFLRSLWRRGQELNADEAARALGDSRLDPQVFIDSVLKGAGGGA